MILEVTVIYQKKRYKGQALLFLEPLFMSQLSGAMNLFIRRMPIKC